jgi:hypothetical protein
VNGASRYIVVLGIAAFCATMWGLLIRGHISVEPHSRLVPDYDSLLPPGETERTTTWGIYLAEARIGDAVLEVQRQDDGTIWLKNRTRIGVPGVMHYVLGTNDDLTVEFQTGISPLTGPEYFQLSSESHDVRLFGNVVGDSMTVTGFVRGEEIRASLPYDKGTLLNELLSPLVSTPELSEDTVGYSRTVDMVNPLSADIEKVTLTVMAPQEIPFEGEPVKVFRLSFATARAMWSTWITEASDVLVQGTPFGIVLRREDLPADAERELKRLAGENPARAFGPASAPQE